MTANTPFLVFPDSSAAAKAVAAEIATLVRAGAENNRSVVLGLATGGTPIPMYQELIRLHKEEGLSFANVTTFNLDEYLGLPKDHKESYWSFMHENLFDHIDVPEENIHLPSGTVAEADIPAHCAEYEKAIANAGGIDIQVLGIGRTGHIGFNEPGTPISSRTHKIHLDPITREDAAPAFGGLENVPVQAITMGCGTILDARRLVLMAWGEKKADIVRQAIEGPVTDEVSASFLQTHPDATFFLDEGAASALEK